MLVVSTGGIPNIEDSDPLLVTYLSHHGLRKCTSVFLQTGLPATSVLSTVKMQFLQACVCRLWEAVLYSYLLLQAEGV